MPEEIEYQPDITMPLDGADAAVADEATGGADDGLLDPLDLADAPDGSETEAVIDGLDLDGEDDATGDVADAAPSPEESVDDIRAKAAEAEQWRRWHAEQTQIAQQQALQGRWNQQIAQAEGWFQQQEAALYQQAEQAFDSVAFLRERLPALRAQRDQWHAQFNASQQQVLWQFAQQQAVPNYAADVASRYGLGQAAAGELLNYPPELMEREAARMRRDRDQMSALKRRATQAQRQNAAMQLADRSVVPGGGRAAGGKIEAGSYDHYNAIPWSRSRR